MGPGVRGWGLGSGAGLNVQDLEFKWLGICRVSRLNFFGFRVGGIELGCDMGLKQSLPVREESFERMTALTPAAVDYGIRAAIS